MNNLDKVVMVHPVFPRQPGRQCTIPPSTLLFEDASTYPRIIHKLDCSVVDFSSPTPFIGTVLNEISDISFTEHDNTQLVFITSRHEGLFSYNACTGELEWKIEGDKSVGITSDERGHLFHCVGFHGEGCVDMYTTKGTFLGALHSEKDEFPGPWRIRWCKKSSSLILVHKRDGQWLISAIAVKYPE